MQGFRRLEAKSGRLIGHETLIYALRGQWLKAVDRNKKNAHADRQAHMGICMKFPSQQDEFRFSPLEVDVVRKPAGLKDALHPVKCIT